MDTEKVLEILKKAKETAPNGKMYALVESFEEFLSLYNQKDTMIFQEPGFFGKLQDSYKRLWETFEQTAMSYGLSVKLLKEYFSDSRNFTGQQWREMQALKQEIVGEEKVGAQAPIQTKLRRRNKHKVKV
ncbi:MAG: hypothetical protein HY861_03155 [Chlamydiia bacterium]|nr:hypothetical protein [Chlamydiia bacterium]